jgi:hypothetical protein
MRIEANTTIGQLSDHLESQQLRLKIESVGSTYIASVFQKFSTDVSPIGLAASLDLHEAINDAVNNIR